LDIVCRGRTTRFLAAAANPSQQDTTRRTTVALTSGSRGVAQSQTTVKTAAGRPPSRQ
jgi:hypothetical protein